AFVYGDRAVGLQFHLEYYTESIEAMLEFCEGELDSTSPFSQAPETIRRDLHHVTRTIPLLHRLLDSLEAVRH
ncbi:MAG TPA: amidotransferase, partial [Candidatus Sumerlaeota bacterium]|nr:amidotransferase [Candidatus Sumerlaeota bacterium]